MGAPDMLMEALVQAIPNWDSTIIGFNQGTLGVLFGLFFAALLVRSVTMVIIEKVFAKFSIENEIAKDAIKDSRGALGTAAGAALFLLISADLALSSTTGGAAVMPTAAARWLPSIAELTIYVSVVLWAFHLVPIVHSIVAALDDDDELDGSEKTLISALESVLRFLIVVFGALFIAGALGFDLTALVAGLGISGLALALAAKDSISNIFGAISVLLDRPFRVGDWVIVGGVEGEVIEINLRTTLLRTSIDTIVTVPNAGLVNKSIENYGKRRWRRYQPTFHLDLDSDPDMVSKFCVGILEIVEQHDKTTKKDGSYANVASLGTQSIDVACNLYWDITSGKEERETRDIFLLDIMRLAKELDLRFFEPRVRRQIDQ